jgi:hypothetical protein
MYAGDLLSLSYHISLRPFNNRIGLHKASMQPKYWSRVNTIVTLLESSNTPVQFNVLLRLVSITWINSFTEVLFVQLDWKLDAIASGVYKDQ